MSKPVSPPPQRETGSGRAIADPFLPFVGNDAIVVGDLLRSAGAPAAGTSGFVYAYQVLQNATDYRGQLQAWFAMLRVGGRLAIEVPHAFLRDRALVLAAQRHPSTKRLYTPASLLAEIEEALEPNSYRIRLLCDHDDGYDYAIGRDEPPVGAHDILLLLERIETPSWAPDTGEVDDAPPPDFAFEPQWTRREAVALQPRRRILILKLDHLGDFIMGMPALEQARRTFADAEITLVVGSWNHAMAVDLGVADTVMAFDAFPRNSSEETVNLAARVDALRNTVIGDYDLAMDLRIDPDTRFFLQHVGARIKAGIGTRAQFPYLDIFLPIDVSRHDFEAAWDRKIEHHGYYALPECHHGAFKITYDPSAQEASSRFITWGPYLPLQVGEYLYEPYIEVMGNVGALMRVDVALDVQQVASEIVSASSGAKLHFTVDRPGSVAEFRIFSLTDHPQAGFHFYGGRLRKRGAASVLHQSEYLMLLITLVEMRMTTFGVLQTDARPA